VRPGERRQVEAVGDLIELHHPAGTPGGIGEPRIESLPPGALMQEIDADEHDRPCIAHPVVDLVGVAREPETGPALAGEADLSAFDLGGDGEATNLLVSGYEFDVAIDAEVTSRGVPYVPCVRHRLIDERFGTETGTLLDAQRGHRQALSRSSDDSAATPWVLADWPRTEAVP
jgi:hypothetical protein